MPALPSDISRFTTDGVVITKENTAIRDMHPDAVDNGDKEIEMFYDSAADTEAMLNEKFTLMSKVNPAHEAIEVDESLGIGTTIPIAPTIPCYRVIDDERELDVVARTRAIAYETGSDRHSIEVIE